ncbi:MAG: hypothetical protein H0A75_00085 [Candidatus Methanofishera endochildressiae]|uniref:Uncharacterized protein n=1 Tax=Candidatus Methanofishera endochildressiae TaxID=2738884 RepID=A0A7Z0SD62_9GAMM|nr:hypothetical protein [Candidatus Methanofishera endochildressiae]
MAATITILGKIVIKRGKTIFYLEKDILILKQTHASALSRQKFDVSQRVRAEETNNLDSF